MPLSRHCNRPSALCPVDPHSARFTLPNFCSSKHCGIELQLGTISAISDQWPTIHSYHFTDLVTTYSKNGNHHRQSEPSIGREEDSVHCHPLLVGRSPGGHCPAGGGHLAGRSPWHVLCRSAHGHSPPRLFGLLPQNGLQRLRRRLPVRFHALCQQAQSSSATVAAASISTALLRTGDPQVMTFSCCCCCCWQFLKQFFLKLINLTFFPFPFTTVVFLLNSCRVVYPETTNNNYMSDDDSSAEEGAAAVVEGPIVSRLQSGGKMADRPTGSLAGSR